MAADPNLIYVNGIDAETGQYAFTPRSIEQLAKQVLVRPGVGAFEDMHADKTAILRDTVRHGPRQLGAVRLGNCLSRKTRRRVSVSHWSP